MGVGMPDDEGYSLAGELPIGSYAAAEFDLGESLCGPLGFTAPEQELFEEGVVFPPGFSTAAGALRHVSPDQVESWGLFRWRTS